MKKHDYDRNRRYCNIRGAVPLEFLLASLRHLSLILVGRSTLLNVQVKMNSFWVVVLFSLAVIMVDAKKGKHHRLFKEKNHSRKTAAHVDCKEIGSRLLDWFHILRTSLIKDEMRAKGLPLPQDGEVLPKMNLEGAKTMLFKSDACREPISSVFHDVFDENKDGMLEFSELPGFSEFSMDPCMMAFFEKCAGRKKSLTEKEFCGCFSSVVPPCLNKLRQNLPLLLVRGEGHPVPGIHFPSCDQDGYFLPEQCTVLDKQGNKKCWCVDRHGSKIEGTTECSDNTEPPTS